MNWQDICDDPALQDLPYKIELNRFGQIVMSPASNEHGRYQTRIAAKLLQTMEGGEVIRECSIDTTDGTKVAEVACGSSAFFAQDGLVTPLPCAPEICVEVVSPSNAEEEMQQKIQLYFEKGAKEVWLCDEFGTIELYVDLVKSESSIIAPGFSSNI